MVCDTWNTCDRFNDVQKYFRIILEPGGTKSKGIIIE